MSGHNGGDSRHAPLFMLSNFGLPPEVWAINLCENPDNGCTMDSESRWARFIPINASKFLCSPQLNFVLASLPSQARSDTPLVPAVFIRAT